MKVGLSICEKTPLRKQHKYKIMTKQINHKMTKRIDKNIQYKGHYRLAAGGPLTTTRHGNIVSHSRSN